MNNVIDISTISLIYTAIFYIIFILISAVFSKNLWKDFVIGGIRAGGQLLIIGFLLQYILKLKSPFYVFLIIFVMILIGTYEAYKRQKLKTKNRKLAIYTFYSLIISYSVVSFFMMFVILKLTPFFNPRYIIPMSGMIIGNSMNSVSVALNAFNKSIKDNIDKIETSLSLGATPYIAVKESLQSSFKLAMMPKINSLMITGLVQLPGMMSGQIISGTLPTTAIKYQYVILLLITSGAGFAVMLALFLNFRSLFGEHGVMKDEYL